MKPKKKKSVGKKGAITEVKGKGLGWGEIFPLLFLAVAIFL